MGMKRDVVVIGGGAAGLMAAIEAGKRGRSVLVLEHAEKVGKKILISGGGRCNFTNVGARAETYLSSNPHFVRSALARYTSADFIGLVEKHRVPYHEKKLGQLFCDDSSNRIVDLLLREAEWARVEIRTQQEVLEVEKTDGFRVQTARESIDANSVIAAAGGLSIPKMGATDFVHRLARRFELRIVPPRPGLVPFTLSGPDLERLRSLSGVSADVQASCNGASFRENLLFTHRGLSGPAILQVSSYWDPGSTVTIDLLPEFPGDSLLADLRPGMKIANWLAQYLPRRFVEAWVEPAMAERNVGTVSKSDLEKLYQSLHRWQVSPAGTEGFAKAEVTVGGVNTDDLSSKTMEARRVPGLFFVGEGVDVTGWLGGYNFQWAWASGWTAGQYA
jgi:predicted Rossmann fold flavoprotein